MLRVGDCVFHRFNSELGTGRVLANDGLRLVVHFPDANETLGFVPNTDALVEIAIVAGDPALLESSGEKVVVATMLDDEHCVLEDGREVLTLELWPLPSEESPVELLAEGTVGKLEDFKNRIDALRLERLREADGLGSFLGGRIRLYPHQLYAAEAACASNPVRWLLADGVGLGKTVEACLIMNRLIHTGRAERTLVIAPESLTVQWLGELWRKHHQIFVLLDRQRIDEVALEQGADFNPFEVHRRAIVALETLIDDPRLVAQAVDAAIDLLVIDEAHHLQRPEGHPGNQAYRAIAPIAGLGRNMLLLTATPLEDDALGFLRLLQLLRPDELKEEEPLLERLESRRSLPSCTSSTRATDIGGWPPRTPAPVTIDRDQWRAFARLEKHLRATPAANEVARGRKATLINRALASPVALAASVKNPDPGMRRLLADARTEDPRVEWLIDHAITWRDADQKTLVFVAHRESLEMLKEALERRARLRVGLFHEELSSKRRDIEVAQLRLDDGPSLLISTECGGEGRNFEMCDRLVLFDMPWHPGVVEQRIGRLDRIGRDRPTEIVYFRPPGGMGAAVVRLYEEMGLFSQSLGGLDRELNHVAREIARVAVDGPEELPPAVFVEVLEKAHDAHTRVQEAAYRELHQNPYRDTMADEILARVPPELETLTASVVLRAAAVFGFDVEQQSGEDTWFIGLGTESLVDRLPGVSAGTRFLGTFDREEAVRRETLDFFASGHPLVEGVLAELHEGDRGRTACFEIHGKKECLALAAVYKRGPDLEVVVVDDRAARRPDLAARLTSADCTLSHVHAKDWVTLPGWEKAVRRMADGMPKDAVPQAVAAFRIKAPPRSPS